MEDRVKRKLVWEKKGVSEIIGTILMLAITVVMFSGIIVWVGTIPAPRESFQVELKAGLAPAVPANWTLGVDVEIAHQGGEVMEDWFIKLFLTVDDTTLTKDLTDGGADVADGEWSVGETWRYNVTKDVATTGPSDPSVFSVLIVNTEKNHIIYQETIGEGERYYPPIIINAWIDSDLGTPNVMDSPVTFTDPFKVYAKIVDPEGVGGDYGLDTNNLWVNLSLIYGESAPLVQLQDVADVNDALHDDVYVAICDPPSEIYPARYPFRFYAWDLTQPTPMSYMRIFYFDVGMIIGENPQIIIKEISFSDDEPVNGDTITITTNIWNGGGVGAEVDVWFYDGDNQTGMLINKDTHGVNITDPPDGIPDPIKVFPSADGEVDADTAWEATPGGLHNITVNAWVNGTYSEERGVVEPLAFIEDGSNTLFRELMVMPKILLVDDDGYINDRTSKDTVSFMRASMEAADFAYDFTIVGAGDGPGYDYGDYPMEDYDVVIWMTGYQTSKTLTKGVGDTDDLTNLEEYLTAGGNATDNGGSLWLISQGFWDEARGDADLATFANTYLHTPDITGPAMPELDPGLPDELYGNDSHPVTYEFEDDPLITIDRITGAEEYVRSYYWNGGIVPVGTLALNSSVNCYAYTYDSDDDPLPKSEDSRLYVQTWDFSRIKNTAKQAQYTYQVLLWLGNITTKFTRDVAISEQTVEPAIVFYKQEVTITFVIRNNGFENYTTEHDLFYRLRILDVNGNELPSPIMVYRQIDFLGYGRNNTVTYNHTWTPLEIGFHRLEIKVDPDNRITESNELNNEISNYLTSGELFVQYRILVVDDDASPNNYGGASPNYNETLEVTTALDYLNATDNYRFEQFIVDELTGGFGPWYDQGDVCLNKYNAVIWVTGADTVEPLKITDRQNISDYLDHRGNLWLIGNGLWTSLDMGVNLFEQDYLRILSVAGDSGTTPTLRGVRDDPVSHGMEFSGVANASADTLTPAPEVFPVSRPAGTGFFYQDDAMTVFNSIRYEGPNPDDDADYRAATTTWLLSDLDEIESKAEIVFMMLRWFDKPESRIETRITNMDIWLSDEHPQLGSGYVIQATVHNTGGSVGNVLVRFMDGNTQIGSDSISVSAGETTTAEIVWIPLFAGQRTLNIYVDPINEVDEIFDWSNNIATMDVYVYFFWDDMESGAGKWAHSSTILLVNGEEPLEYFYDTALDTNIITEWDDILSIDIHTLTDSGFYHSHDTAYWLQEPAGGAQTGGRFPIDVVIALDSSGSMEWDASDPPVDVGWNDPTSRWYNARVAAIGFIQDLTEFDRCALYTFNGVGGVTQLRVYEFMTNANKNNFIAALNGYGDPEVSGGTPFYDMMGEAIQYVWSNILDPHPTNPFQLLSQSRNEFVIGLGDGASNSDTDWTPNCEWTNSMSDNEHTPGNGWYTMDGILFAPPMSFVIGLAGIDHDGAYPVAPNWSRTSPIEGTYPDEYDMWHVADSSPILLHDAGGKYGENETTGDDNVGHYYYTDNPLQLPAIFEEILETIEIVQLEGMNQTRSAPPGPEAMAATNYDYVGVTPVAGPHDAYYQRDNGGGFDVNNWDMTAGGSGWTEYDNFRYGQTAIDDANTWTYDNSRSKYYRHHFYIAEPEADVTQIDVFMNYRREAADANEEELYIWNDNNNQWEQLDRITATGWQSLSGSVSANCDQYISAAGLVTTGFFSRDPGPTSRWIYMDYTNITIHYTASDPPYIISTVPADGANEILTTSSVVITFSEEMNIGTVTWTCNDMGLGWAPSWNNPTNTVLTLSHATPFDPSTPYTFQVLTGDDMDGEPLSIGPTSSVSVRVSSDNDDAEQDDPGGAMSLGSTDLELVYDGAQKQLVGMRFQNINVPPGAYITNAYVEFECDNDDQDSGATSLVFYGEDVDDASTFTLANNDISNRPLTTASVNWPNVPAWTFNNQYQTPDISPIIQEIVDRGGWISGNDMVIIVDGSGERTAECHDDDPSEAPLLVIEYTTAAPNPWTFTTVGPPTIMNTVPIDGDIAVLLNQDVIITFSETIDTASFAYTCIPDPLGWVEVWSAGDRVVTLSHTNFASITNYTFTVNQADDLLGNGLIPGPAPNPWTFTTVVDNPPEITNTIPADGAFGVAVNQNIVITFNEPMNTGSVTYACIPNPGGWVESWSVGDTVLTLTHTNFNQDTTYVVQVTQAQDLTSNDLIAGVVPNPWSFRTIDLTPPTIISTTPSDGSSGVGLSQPVMVRFSEPMDLASVELAFSITPDPGGWTFDWDGAGTEMSAYHYDFNMSTLHTCTVINLAKDLSGNNLAASATPNPWDFTTGTTGGGGGGVSPMIPNTNKTAVTKTMDLADLETAKLSFWQKYNMMPGANGGFLQVGYKDGTHEEADGWAWRYVIPANAYTGNLKSDVTVNDSFGTRVFWCWNGVSGRGTFSWDYVSMDLLSFVPPAYRDEVKVKFNYTQYGGGTGYGWYIDDVRVTVSRPDTLFPDDATQDIWNLTDIDSHNHGIDNNTHCWSNVDPTTGYMKPGIDNYLKTTPIDLTKAKNAYLSAYFKFNLNYAGGAPPDGFRVEVTKDGGVSWTAINFGVRSSWGVSGTGDDDEDGTVDGKAYTGLSESGDPVADDYWVNASSLSRLNVDLSSFSGNAIQIRFRMVTCNHPGYAHNDNANYAFPVGSEFGGFYVDDVQVFGETILT